MTTDLLDFPVIDTPPPVAAPVPAPVAQPAASATVAVVAPSIKETVLAQFKDAEAGMLVLAEKYRGVAYDCKTTKGMAEAVAARADLRDNGRLALTRAEARVKKDVNDLKKVMGDEVDRLVAIVKPVEDAIDAQIQAEVQRKADEKAKREKAEAERIEAHKERLAKIGGYLTHCQQPGMTAARIQVGIDKLAAATFGPDWQEFAVPAADLQCKTLEAMRQLHAQAVEREAEAKRLEEQRQEQERVAAAQAETQRQLDEAAEALRLQQAETARQAAEVEAARVAMLGAPAAAGTYAQALAVEQAKPDAERDPVVEWTLGQAVAAANAVLGNPPFDKTAQPGVQTPAAQGEVAGNLAQPQPGATFPPGDAAAEDEAGAIPQGATCAPAPSVTLTPHQLLLAEACDLLDAWLTKPPTKKQAVACFALIASLRDRGNLPRPTNTLI